MLPLIMVNNMSVISRSTQVKVLRGIPFDNTFSDVIKFNNVAEQTTYFSNKAKRSYTQFSYQRVNKQIANPRLATSVRVPEFADNLYDCNYIMFNNYNKWFYAFIKSINYINEHVTEIMYEIDPYQTYQFDYTVQPSIVEREHSRTDEPFTNNEPEPLTIADYHKHNTEFIDVLKDNVVDTAHTVNGRLSYYLMVRNGLASSVVTGLGDYSYAGTIQNIPYDCYYKRAENYERIKDSVLALSTAGVGDDIIGMHIGVLSISPLEAPPKTRYYDSVISVKPQSDTIAFNILRPYKVQNQKCFSFPFHKFIIRDALSTVSKVYQPQLFIQPTGITHDKIHFNIQCVTAFPQEILFIPQYDGKQSHLNNGFSYEYAIPVSASTEAVYTTNGSVVNGLLQIGTGLLAPNSNAVMNGINEIGNMSREIGSFKNFTPLALERVGITIDEYYAENIIRIDEFFSMYGYATNELKIPNEDSRPNWNYVKTNNVILNGSMPVDSMARIKKMYNDGVRFWRPNAEFLNFAQDNRAYKGEKQNEQKE